MVVSAVDQGCDWALRIKFGKGSKNFPTCVLVQVQDIDEDTDVRRPGLSCSSSHGVSDRADVYSALQFSVLQDGEPMVLYRYWKNTKGDTFVDKAAIKGTRAFVRACNCSTSSKLCMPLSDQLCVDD